MGTAMMGEQQDAPTTQEHFVQERSIVLPWLSTTIGLFVVTVLLLYRIPRFASYAGIGSTWYAVPIARAVRVLGTLVLAACLACTLAIRRRLRNEQPAGVGAGLAGWLIPARSAVGLGVYEWHVYWMTGLTPRRYQSVVFDHTDLNYLHAVRARLKELGAGTDSELARAKSRSSADGEITAELVDQLQKDMVTWTEQQVALWDSDIKQRWADLMLFGYQIRPRSDGRGPAEAKYRAELSTIQKQRKLLPVLCDYCQARLARMGKGTVSAKDLASVDDLESQLRQLAKTATEQERRMVAWATARHAEPGWITTQMNLAQQRCEQIESRLQFDADVLDSLFSESTLQGIDARYPQLRLPIQLPDVRSTARTLMLVRWAMLLWMMIGVGTLGVAVLRWRRARLPHTLLASATFWQILAGVGILVFLLLG